MAQFGRQFRKGFEYKSPLSHSRMRDLEAGHGYDGVAEQQNIDIDQPWTFRNGWLSAELSFDPLKPLLQLHRK